MKFKFVQAIVLIWSVLSNYYSTLIANLNFNIFLVNEAYQISEPLINLKHKSNSCLMTVLLQSLTTSCLLYTWEQTNSSNKFAANLNMKGISFLLLTLYSVSPKKFLFRNHSIVIKRVLLCLREFKLASKTYSSTMYTED